MKTIVLHRVPAYSKSGIDFIKGEPRVVDDILADAMLETGMFREGCYASPNVGYDDLSGTGIVRFVPPEHYVVEPKNYIGSDDLSGKRVLLRRFGGIGDCVFVAVFAQYLKSRYPTVHIEVAVQPEYRDFMGVFDAFDTVRSYDSSTKADVVHSFHYIVAFDGVIGAETPAAIDNLPYFPAHWERARMADSVQPGSIPRVEIMNLVANLETYTQATEFLATAGFGDVEYVVLLLGTSNPLKRLRVEQLSEIAAKLSSQKDDGTPRLHVVCLGGGHDRVFTPETQWVTLSTTLPIQVSCELIRRSNCVIGADTGLMHFAAAIGVPTVSLWGPTDPTLSMDWYAAPKEMLVSDGDVPCIPCRHIRTSFCRYYNSGYTGCMKAFLPAAVVQSVYRILQENSTHPARGITTDDALRQRANLDATFNVAVLLDNADDFTGGGYYTWGVAKMLASLPNTRVVVYTDTPMTNFVYVRGDYVPSADKLSIVTVDAFDNATQGIGFNLIIGTPPFTGPIAVKLAKSSGARSLLLVYETPAYIADHRDGEDAKEPYWREYKRALHEADLIWPISSVVRTALLEWIPDARETALNVTTVHPVVNTAVAGRVLDGLDPALRHKKLSVVMIARNMPYKMLRQALATVCEAIDVFGRTVTVHVIGQNTTKLAHHLVPGIKHAEVEFHEKLPEEEKWRILSTATVLVHPSIFEGFGIPIAEGLYAGCTVLAQPLEVLQKEFGNRITYFDNYDGLSEKLIATLRMWRNWLHAEDREESEDSPKPHIDAQDNRAYVERRFTQAAVLRKVNRSLEPLMAEYAERVDVSGALVSTAQRSQRIRLAFVGPWNARCGIAETTREWAGRLGCIYHVFSYTDVSTKGADGNEVTRCWNRKFEDTQTLLAQLMDYQPNVVHFQHEHSVFQNEPALFQLMDSLRARGIRVVITLHTYLPSGFSDALAKHVDTIITTKPMDGMPPNTTSIPLPVNLQLGGDRVTGRQELGISENDFMVGSFGMWQVHKGFDEFLATRNDVALRFTNTNVIYTICGSAGHKSQYMQETRRKHVDAIKSGAVRILDDYPPMFDVMRRLSACDVLVFNYSAAHYTSASAALRVGMLAGVPIVCTHSPLFSEFEHNTHVIKVQFGESSQLVDAILKLRDEPDFGKRLVTNCQKYLAECSDEAVAKRHEMLYTTLIFGDSGTRCVEDDE